MAGPNFFDQADAPTPTQQRRAAEERRAEASNARAERADKRAQAEFDTKNAVVPAPGDTSLTGEEYLKTLPANLARQVKMIAEGRRPLPTGYALRNPQVQELIAAATQYDPSLDAANAMTRVATRKDFTSGKAAANITAINTAIGHLLTLRKNAQALNNTRFPVINRIGNALSRETGGAAVKNFQIARQAVASELTRVFRGTGGSLSEVKEWEDAIDAAGSPEQLDRAIRQATELLNSRLESMQEQYRQGMGRSADIREFLTPKHQQDLNALLGAGVDAPGASGDDKTADVFAGPPEGAQISGEDVKGWRYTPETEQKLLAAIRDPKATPEGFAAYNADAAVAEGHVKPEDRDAYLTSSLPSYAEYFKTVPAEQRATVEALDYSGIDRQATEDAGLGTSLVQTLRNVPESAANLAEGLVALPGSAIASAVTGKPVGATKGVLDLAGEMGSGPNTDALMAALKDRYSNPKRTAITDPIGLAGDVSAVATAGGGAAARAGGALGKAGEVAQAAGKLIDPVTGAASLATEGLPNLRAALANKAPVVTDFIKGAPATIAGLPSGAGGSAVREAVGAGFERGRAGAPTARSEAFVGNMRDPLSNIDEVVATARDAVANLRQQASQRYTDAMQRFGQKPTPLPMDNVLMRMAKLKPRNYDAMLSSPKRPSDHLAWEQMMQTVEHYAVQAAQDPSLLEPLAMDAFKQDLYDIGSKIGGAYDRQAARIAGTAYNAVRQELVKHDPLYAKTMRDYETAAKEAQQLEGTFALGAARGKQVNVDSATRRLQSIMRNNANTNYGQRAAQGERLAELDPSGTLIPSLAGQMVSSPTPRGLHTVSALSTGAAAAMANPLALPVLAAFSPRVTGEAAYALGRGAGAVRRAVDNMAPIVDRAAELYQKYPAATLATSSAGNRLEDQQDELRRRYGIDVPIGGY